VDPGRPTEEGPRGWAAPLHAAVLGVTEVRPGTALLDLGCGTGLLARAAADRGAAVTGIDADPRVVAQAAAEVPDGTFAVGDAADPPAGPFDVVTAVQLLAHVPDPQAVLAAAGRVGAVVAVTVWGREDECALAVLGEALAPWLGKRPPPAAPDLADPARLRRLAGRAGLAASGLHEVVCPFRYADANALVGPLLASGPGRAAARRVGPRVVQAAVLRRLEPYRTPLGGYRLDNLFRVLVARPR
jgi:SAM-dependent methyltransferase